MGFEVPEEELQTPAGAAARELRGKRVFALVMSGVVPDLEGLELVGDGAEAVLVGGCDESFDQAVCAAMSDLQPQGPASRDLVTTWTASCA